MSSSLRFCKRRTEANTLTRSEKGIPSCARLLLQAENCLGSRSPFSLLPSKATSPRSSLATPSSPSSSHSSLPSPATIWRKMRGMPPVRPPSPPRRCRERRTRTTTWPDSWHSTRVACKKTPLAGEREMCSRYMQTAWLEGFPDDVVVETRGRTTARPAMLLLAKSVSLLPAPTRQERS